MAWFPFYVNDWLGSKRVKRMTNEQRGVYMSLLVWQWQGKGYLDGSMEENLVLADAYPPELEKWKPVLACFESDGNGRWFNRKLLDLWESELEKREKHCRGAELTNAKRHAERTAERDTKRPDSVTPPSPSPSPSPSPDPTPPPKLASLAPEDERAMKDPDWVALGEIRNHGGITAASFLQLKRNHPDADWSRIIKDAVLLDANTTGGLRSAWSFITACLRNPKGQSKDWRGDMSRVPRAEEVQP